MKTYTLTRINSLFSSKRYSRCYIRSFLHFSHTVQFAPNSYQNAIEGFFQIRHACQASWYSGKKDLGWISPNIVGAIHYCVYPEDIQGMVTLLRETANQLACENNLPECEQ